METPTRLRSTVDRLDRPSAYYNARVGNEILEFNFGIAAASYWWCRTEEA